MVKKQINETIKKKLTKRVIDEAEPKAQRYSIQDTEIPGYALRVHPTGRKSYVVDYREQDTERRRCIKVGDAAILTPDNARAKALEIRRLIANGISPQEERVVMRHTFASLMNDSDASAEVMMKLLGHSDFKTTQGYIHSFKKKKGESKAEAVSAAMQKFLSLPPLEIPPSNVISLTDAKKDTKAG